ncbi:MAG: cytochrome c biogenesis protein CcsA [Candidatus Hodarchaeales archaeon]|jgi:cytochrome c biogenesis factor
MIYIGFGTFGMDLGALILLISLIAFVLDAILVLLGKYVEKWEIYSEMSLSTGMVALLIAFLYFSYSIIINDYSFFYVSEYVNNDMDIFFKLSAIWSGQAGSYFFWAFLIGVAYYVFRLLFRDYAHEPMFWRSFALASVQVSVLMFLAILSNPFKLNSTIFTDGLGLNPFLMNIWNVIHPPIIFIGYALCLIPMVIAIARISLLEDGKVPEFEGKQKLDSFFEFMVSIAWLVLSSGIIVGGYWAYITLGWGGFWAWDPVETASLIPWLFITLYFHGRPFLRKHEYLNNYIVSMSYIGALFVTYITRGGIITSVHAFVPSGSFERLLVIIIPKNSFLMSMILRFIPEERILILFLLISISFLLPHIYGFTRREIGNIPLFIGRKDFQSNRARITALKMSFLAGLIGTYIIIFALITPVIYDILGYLVTFSTSGFGARIVIDQPIYNTIITVFGGTMLLAQFFCTFFPRVTINRKFQLLIGGVTAGIVFSITGYFYRTGGLKANNPIIAILGPFLTTSEKANLVLPLIVLGIVGLLAEFIRVALREEKDFIRKTSQVMLHLSFLIIILGALMSTNMTNTQSLIAFDGDQVDIPGTSLTITILDLERVIPQSGQHSIEYNTKFMISSGSKVVGFGISSLYWDRANERFGINNRQGQDVTIISNLLSDIYIVTIWYPDLHGQLYDHPLLGFTGTALQIKIIPYINGLWAGCILLHFAILPLVIGRYMSLTKVLSVKDEQKDTKEESGEIEIKDGNSSELNG